jgi:membrane-anchored protein YejM (alkaline phosphatase superfamily)
MTKEESMAAKKSIGLYIGLALLVIGTLELLNALGFITIGNIWILPVILILVGILVVINTKRTVHILGWICLLYGVALLLMNTGLFHSTFLWKISPVSWVLFGLILIL